MYLVVGNPIPYSGIIRGPGQELFTDSVLALNVRTGKLRWYFQLTHHDIWDYDATNPVILFDLNGKKGIAEAGKTGWVYILNRTNGKPLIGINEKPVPQLKSVNTYPTQPYPVGDAFSKQCATKSVYAGKLAPDKKPYKVGCIYTPYDDKQFVAFAPGALGGTNWPPSAYSPDTGYMYICSKDTEGPWRAIPAEKQKLKPLGDFSQVEGLLPGGGIVSVPATGRVVAMNMRNNRIAWQVRWPTMCYSGVTTTAGNLLFVGTNEGFLHAYNARNGNLLWKSPKLKGGVNAPPVTYTANDKQYVAVFAGGNGIASLVGDTKPFYGSTFYAFALPGRASSHAEGGLVGRLPLCGTLVPRNSEDRSSDETSRDHACTLSELCSRARRERRARGTEDDVGGDDGQRDGDSTSSSSSRRRASRRGASSPSRWSTRATPHTTSTSRRSRGRRPTSRRGRPHKFKVTFKKAGEFRFICTVPRHVQFGMAGYFKVK